MTTCGADDLKRAVESWKQAVDEASNDVAATGIYWLNHQGDLEATRRHDEAWKRRRRVLAGDEGIDLPPGYTVPPPPWRRP